MDSSEFVVLGLGAMGSATAWQLAKRGRTVIGVDRFDPPHAHGSSHGETRITRLAIGEGLNYSPLAMRSHELWRELEAETAPGLLNITGALIISSPARTAKLHVEDFFANTVAAAQRYGIAHEILSTAQIRRRFPQFRIAEGEIGYYEPGGGFLRPKSCIAAELRMAGQFGAEIRTCETVLRFDASADRVIVHTARRSIVARKLIVCAGPWLPELIGQPYAAPFRILRQVLFWFAADDPARYLPESCPVYIWELQGPGQAIYGFPAVDGPNGGIKVATQQYANATTPSSVDREVSSGEIQDMYRNNVAPFLKGVQADCLKTTTCLYTQTPDSGFVICPHPKSDRIIIASACSGHGFKHSAAIGEALAEIAVEGHSRLDLSAFSLSRFSG